MTTPARVLALIWSVGKHQSQVVQRAGGHVRVLHIDIGHLAVAPGHLQAGVPQQALRAELISHVANRGEFFNYSKGGVDLVLCPSSNTGTKQIAKAAITTKPMILANW